MTIAASSSLNGFNLPSPAAQDIDKRLNKGEKNADQQTEKKHEQHSVVTLPPMQPPAQKTVNKHEKLSVVTPTMQPPVQQTVPRFQQTVNLSATQGQKWSEEKQLGNSMVCSPLAL